MSVRSLLSMECTIKRWATRTPTGPGVVGSPLWSDVKTGVKCLVQHHSAKVLRSEHGINVTYNATGFFLIDEDIRAKPGQSEQADRIVVTKNGSGTYQTRGVLDEAGKKAMLTVALEAV